MNDYTNDIIDNEMSIDEEINPIGDMNLNEITEEIKTDEEIIPINRNSNENTEGTLMEEENIQIHEMNSNENKISALKEEQKDEIEKFYKKDKLNEMKLEVMTLANLVLSDKINSLLMLNSNTVITHIRILGKEKQFSMKEDRIGWNKTQRNCTHFLFSNENKINNIVEND